MNVAEIHNEVEKKYSTFTTSYIDKVLEHLESNNFIEKNPDNTITVTYQGIQYISKERKYPIESLGIISMTDVKKIMNRFNSWIIEESQKNDSKTVSIEKIKSEFNGIVGDQVIMQLIQILENKGTIQRKGNNIRVIPIDEKSISLK